MAGKYGADVEQLRLLAQQMTTASERLERDRLTVGHQIKISAWVGPFAATFKARWESEHSLHVASVARALEANATRLRKNADEQEAASAADGVTSITLRPAAPDLAGFWDEGLSVFLRFPDFNPFSWMHPFVDLDRRPHNPFPVPWGDLLPRNVPSDWLGQLQASIPFGPWMVSEGDRAIGDTGWQVKDVATLLPIVGTGSTIYDGITRVANGQIPWHEAIDLGAGAARSSGNPIAFGLGWAAANMADAAQLAIEEVDWSPTGIQDAWMGLSNPDAWGEVGHDLVTRFPKFLMGNTVP